MIDEHRRARLHALLDGELSGVAKLTLEAEIAIDPELADEFASAERIDRALRTLLSPVGATDDAIAAAVLARAPITPHRKREWSAGAPDLATWRGWLAPLALAAALLLAALVIPLPNAPQKSGWSVASGGGSAIWIETGVKEKNSVIPGEILGGDGELWSGPDRALALRDPAGAEVYLAPRSTIALEAERATLLGGRVWVRSEHAVPFALGEILVEGRGSFSLEERKDMIIVSALAGEVLVLRGEPDAIRLSAGMQLVLGGKGDESPRPSRSAVLQLGWALTAIAEASGEGSAQAATPGSALAELIDGHLAALEDEETAPMALKGIADWLGPVAIPSLVDRILEPTKTPASSYRRHLVWALGETVARGKTAEAQVERLFELPLAIEAAFLGDVVDALAAATGIEPIPDRGFWYGKSGATSPEERKKALDAWRLKWLELRRADPH